MSPHFREVAAHFGLGPGARVVFTAHEPPDIPFADYAVYNMEQLTCREMPAYFYDRLRAARVVWDYSAVNVGHLRARGIHATHVPYLPPIRPAPAAAAAAAAASHDRAGAVFVGAVNARRADWFAGLPVHAVTTVTTNDCWGADRDALYAKAVLGLNVHFYGGPDSTILEVHRIAPMLRAGLLVVSERSCDAYYDDLMERAGVVFVDSKQDFQETVRVLLRRPDLAIARLLYSEFHFTTPET